MTRPRVTGASDLIDVTLLFRQERPAAIAVVQDDKSVDPWIWLPKSQIEFRHIGGGALEITMPEWLAREKGLI